MNDEASMGRRAARSPIGDVLTEIDDHQAIYLEVVKRVRERVKKAGVPPPRRPNMKELGQLDIAVSRMTNAELGDKQGEFAVWENYLGPLIADVKTEAAAKKEYRDCLLAALKSQATGPQSGKADKAKSDPRFIEANADWLAAKGTADALQARMTGQETQRQVCSRYVEIRKIETESHTRTENVRTDRGRSPRFRG